MKKLKGVKGQIIITGIGGFDTDEQKDNFRKLWNTPTGFKFIDPPRSVSHSLNVEIKDGMIHQTKKKKI